MSAIGADDVNSSVLTQLDFLRELNDVKRLYARNLHVHSYASLVFCAGAKALSTGESLKADVYCASIVSAARLGAITLDVLLDSGISQQKANVILKQSISVHKSLSIPLRHSLLAACDSFDQVRIGDTTCLPDWVIGLATSPRAGATCPGKPRIALEPAEMHSDHCLMVAAYAYLLADVYGACREDAWLIGLCHHLHNAYLPDAGFTGEMLLGDQLDNVVNSLRLRALNTISVNYSDRIVQLFIEINDLSSPLAKTFHAADTIDRVVQMEHYERAAQFRVSKALEEFNLVHEGDAQEFQHDLLRSLGISYKTLQ